MDIEHDDVLGKGDLDQINNLTGNIPNRLAGKAKQAAMNKVKRAIAKKFSGSKLAAVLAKAAGAHVKKVALIVVGLSLCLLWPAFQVISAIHHILHPFSINNTSSGVSKEAMMKDMGDDDEFKDEMDIGDGEDIDQDQMYKYPVDDITYDPATGLMDENGSKTITGQYSKMAELIQDGAEKGYEASLNQYYAEKASARASYPTTHVDSDFLYEYDGEYYTSAVVEGTRVSEASTPVSDKVEPEGDVWDDSDYLNDNANGGKVDSGIAYILAAYAVSKGNTAPPVSTKDEYSYYDDLEELLTDTDVQSGFFPYDGNTMSSKRTMTATVVSLQKETRYEKPANGDRTPFYNRRYFCDFCTRNHVNYTVAGESNEKYEVFKQDDGTFGTCSNCHRLLDEESDVTDKIYEAKPYDVWIQLPSADSQEFEYTSYGFQGTIGAFSTDDLLRRLFIEKDIYKVWVDGNTEDRHFYADITGGDLNSIMNGGAATIKEGEAVELPAGLGRYFTFMGWQCITNKNSKQYELIQKAGMNFDSEGFGKINGRYVVACTTTYGNVGDYVDFYQSNDNVLQCIIGDIKNQNDSECNAWGHKNGNNVVEFIVNKPTWYVYDSSGHLLTPNPGTTGCHPEWGGQTIVKAVNGGSYFDNPDFVKSLSGDDPGLIDIDSVIDGRDEEDDLDTTKKPSDLQLKVVAIAKSYLGSTQWKRGNCAGFTNDVYMYAGQERPSANAIDYWTKWGSSGSSSAEKIPIGAAVVGSGSSSELGMIYGHVGIYVGDIDGDGVGNVIDSGGVVNCYSSVSSWCSWQVTPVHAWNGAGTFGPGFVGWVWPNNNKLGDGVEFTNADLELLDSIKAMAVANGIYGDRLDAIMDSDYYQWRVYYHYTCDHDMAETTTCPECGAPYQIRSDAHGFWQNLASIFTSKYDRPVFEYVKPEDPDTHITIEMGDDGKFEEKEEPISVKDKIQWYTENILQSVDAASKYENPSSALNGPRGSGQLLVNFALERLGNNGSEAWAFSGFQADWCAMFVSMCAYKCGYMGDDYVCYARDSRAFGTGGIIPCYNVVSDGAYAFQSIGRYQREDSGYEPQPGDIAFISWGHGKEISNTQHTEIVIGVDPDNPGYVWTVGGNTGSGGRGFRYSSVNKQHLYAATQIAGYGVPAYPASDNMGGDSEAIKAFLLDAGLTNEGAAGLMGNMYAESGLRGCRLQGDFSPPDYEPSVSYASKVDSGEISKYDFANNGPNGGGFGIVQFTDPDLKSELYDYVKSNGSSIGSTETQLEFLMQYFPSNFSHMWYVLKTSHDVEECANVVLTEFERPKYPNLTERVSYARRYL